MKPNKITGSNASGRRQLPMRTRWVARVAQFCRYGVIAPVKLAILSFLCLVCAAHAQTNTIAATNLGGRWFSEDGFERIVKEHLATNHIRFDFAGTQRQAFLRFNTTNVVATVIFSRSNSFHELRADIGPAGRVVEYHIRTNFVCGTRAWSPKTK